jgi:hypothetical protein
MSARPTLPLGLCLALGAQKPFTFRAGRLILILIPTNNRKEVIQCLIVIGL